MQHISEDLVAKFEIQTGIESLQKIILKYLVDYQISFQVDPNDTNLTYWINYGLGKPLGFVRIESTIERRINLSVCWVGYEGDTAVEINERYTNIKGLLQNLIRDFLRAGTFDFDIEVLVNRLTLAPMTQEEREERKKRDQETRLFRKGKGFYKRILLDDSYETSAEAIRRLLRQYIYRQREFGSHFWDLINPDYWLENNPEWAKDLSVNGRGYFGDLGKITLLQTNSNRCKITIENAWEALPFVEPAEADALYFETLEELRKLVAYIVDTFSDKSSKPPENLEAVQQNPGRQFIISPKEQQDDKTQEISVVPVGTPGDHGNLQGVSEKLPLEAEDSTEIIEQNTLTKNMNDVKRLSERKITIKNIARHIGISESTVKRYRDELGITRKRKG